MSNLPDRVHPSNTIGHGQRRKALFPVLELHYEDVRRLVSTEDRRHRRVDSVGSNGFDIGTEREYTRSTRIRSDLYMSVPGRGRRDVR